MNAIGLDATPIEVQVREANLKRFCQSIARGIGYPFDDADWDAIVHGIAQTSAARGLCFEYPFLGDKAMRLTAAKCDASDLVSLRLVLPEGLADSATALADVLRHYDRDQSDWGLTTIVASAFDVAGPQADGDLLDCAPDHVAECAEHQQARSTFLGKRWTDFAQDGWRIPVGYAGIGFLSAAARRYFFPAYLLAAIYQKDRWPLDEALRSLPRAETAWSPLQSALIEIVAHDLDAHERSA